MGHFERHGNVCRYFLSNAEGEEWARPESTEMREFNRKWMRRYEPPSTRIEVYDGWGALLEAFEV